MAKTVVLPVNVAHTGSGHAAPGPPAVSAIMPPPPTCPTGPFPVAPFLYIAKASAAQSNSCSGPRSVIGGNRILLQDSCMDIEQPGNMPSKPTDSPANVNPADQVSKVIVGLAIVLDAKGTKIKVNRKDKIVAVTGALCALNIPGPKRKVHQCESALLEGGGLIAAACDHSKNPARVVATGDPVAVASGQVHDEALDLYLPGMIEVRWKRLYSTGRTDERSPLGRGGWTHAYDQWIETTASGLSLRDGDGRDIALGAVAPRSTTLLRGKRLEVTRMNERYEVRSLDTRLVREFAPHAPQGRAVLQAIRDPFGNRVTLRYEGARLAMLVDTAGRELKLLPDEKGRIQRVEVWARGELQQWVDHAYSAEGELASVTDALGHAERYAYDGRHRLIEKALKNGVRFRYTYEEDTGRCVRSRADGGLQNVELVWNDAERTTTVSGTPEPREYTWNARGDIVREATFDGSWARERDYDDDQLVIEERNAAGHARRYERDERGNLIRFTRPDGAIIACEYRDDLVVARTDPGEKTIRFEYDARGALTRMDYATGAPELLSWDRNGRLVGKTMGGVPTTQITWDEMHNPVRVVEAAGAAYAYTYDAMGRALSETDALGRVTRWSYDRLGRPIQQQLPDGTELTFAYDPLGNIVNTADEQGAAATSVHAGTGTMVRHTRPDGSTWELAYDTLERLREIKNPRAEVHRFRYDRAGRVIEEETFDGQTIRYQHSRAGRVARIDYADETWIEAEYDDGGFLVKESSPHGDVLFSRNEVGWIVKAVVEEHGGPVTIEREWDESGKLLAEVTDGAAVTYTYDELGRPATRTLPNGELTRYHYDARGLLIGVEHGGEKVLLQRDSMGREVRRYAYGSKVDMRFAWNADDRLTDQLVGVASSEADKPSVLVQRRWAYGAHSRMRAAWDATRGATEYQHDVAGLLTSVEQGDRQLGFEYDANGALAASFDRQKPGAPWTLRMGSLVASTGAHRFEYDARRRRRRKIALRDGQPTDVVTEYVWDCRDHLREVRLPEGERVLFKYDAFGRRVKKTLLGRPGADGVTPSSIRVVRYVWDHDELAMEIDSERGERVFVHEPRTFRPLLHTEQGERFLYVCDPLGVPKELVDHEGKLAWSAAHTPWGRATEVKSTRPADKSVSTPFRLLGHYEDEQTGLCFARHRAFDADTARWLSRDPLGMDGGNNAFAFDGSPLRDVDPLGLMTAGRFQSWLERTHGPRAAAQAAAEAHQQAITAGMGPQQASIHVAASSKPTVGPAAVGQNTPGGNHAEVNVGGPTNAQGNNGLTGNAVGAGINHCGNCTNHIMASGGYPSTSIRGTGYGSTGWNPGQPPAGSDGGSNW
jgi:RHS repeat-associated protein